SLLTTSATHSLSYYRNGALTVSPARNRPAVLDPPDLLLRTTTTTTTGHRLLWTLTCTRVRLGPLPMNGQAAAMAQAAIAANLGQSLDVHRDFPPQVAFDRVIVVDDLPQAGYIHLRQVLDARFGIDTGLAEDFLAAAGTDAMNISQASTNLFITRNINTGDTSHNTSPTFLLNPVAAYGSGFRR